MSTHQGFSKNLYYDWQTTTNLHPTVIHKFLGISSIHYTFFNSVNKGLTSEIHRGQ